MNHFGGLNDFADAAGGSTSELSQSAVKMRVAKRLAALVPLPGRLLLGAVLSTMLLAAPAYSQDSSSVAAVQRLLADKGCDPGTVDGQ